MAFFKEASSIITTAISQISKLDQEYLRYIGYDYEDPLNSYYPDIDGKTLINKRISPFIKIPDAKTNASTFVNVHIGKSDPFFGNTGFRKIHLVIDVGTQENLQLTKDPSKVRVLEICSGIDELFNDKKIVGLGEKRIFFESMNVVYFSQTFVGYRLMYRLEVNSNVGCGG